MRFPFFLSDCGEQVSNICRGLFNLILRLSDHGHGSRGAGGDTQTTADTLFHHYKCRVVFKIYSVYLAPLNAFAAAGAQVGVAPRIEIGFGHCRGQVELCYATQDGAATATAVANDTLAGDAVCGAVHEARFLGSVQNLNSLFAGYLPSGVAHRQMGVRSDV